MDKNRLSPKLSTASDHGYMVMRGSQPPTEEGLPPTEEGLPPTEEGTKREHDRPQSAISDEYVEINEEARYRIEPITSSLSNEEMKPRAQKIVHFQDNCAYNATVRFEEREENTQHREHTTNALYEEISDTPVPENSQTSGPRVDIEGQADYKTILPGDALCSFWQGKAEIAIRITNLALGAVVFLMLLAAMSNAGRIYNTSLGPLLSNQFRPTAVFVTIGCWMVVLAFAGTVEVFLCVARVYLAKGAKYILVWDIVHSIILYVLYLVCMFQMIWLTVMSTTLDQVPGALIEVNGQVGLLATCAILVFAYAGLYMLKAGWVIAFIKQNWSKKMDEYTQSQNK